MDDEFIQLKKVSKAFGKNKVLDEINLSIPEGKITGIIGASGEGKSTILKLIASFYDVDSGEIFYFRRNIKNDITHIKKSFGIAIESGSFYENLTVYENLYHFGRLYNVDRPVLKRRIGGIIRFVGLEEARNVLSKNLSLGMKKRLDLACALVHKPSVLILDEPTADLDPLLRTQMLKLIKKINSHGTTVIFTTQMLEEIDIMCDYVAILYNENIHEEDSLADVLKKYNAKDMNSVFTKIFSKKGRKTYLESTEKKSKIDLKKEKKSAEDNSFVKELKEDEKESSE
jgi:ABC-2 type transport system ATP-binding protein